MRFQKLMHVLHVFRWLLRKLFSVAGILFDNRFLEILPSLSIIFSRRKSVTHSMSVDNNKNSGCGFQKCEYVRKQNESLKCDILKLSRELQEKEQMVNQFIEKERSLKAERNKAQNKLDELTAMMSHNMVRENKGEFETPCDLFNPTKIAKELESLYEGHGLKVVEMFGEDKEIEGVDFIFSMMQKSYEFCRKRANRQILAFTTTNQSGEYHDDEDENGDCGRRFINQVLKDNEIKELYLLRWKLALAVSTREQTRREFVALVKNDLDGNFKVKFRENESSFILEDFIGGCADCCWLIATCYPPLKLRFDVKDKMREGWIKQYFKKYTTSEKVTMNNHQKGYVTSVVWPALVAADDNMLYHKGEVIAVD